MKFSILIPTWNNLEYLQLCLRSIRQHSRYNHQVILFVNEGSDGTLHWVQEQKEYTIEFLHSPENIGICHAMNRCRDLVTEELMVYLNDDMYVLPDWDHALQTEIASLNTRKFMVSATMIEPVITGNDCVVVKNYGEDLPSFRESDLLEEFPSLKQSNWQGSTWPPMVLHRETWDLLGGFSIEFSPGMYSDPDLSFKLVEAGGRVFMGVGSSLVYHFGSKSTGRLNKNPGHATFVRKWGITARQFTTRVLKMGKPYAGPIKEPDLRFRNGIVARIKRYLANRKSHA